MYKIIIKYNLLSLIVFFTLSTLTSYGQIRLDAEPVDIIDLYEHKFYYKSDDTYDLLEINFKLKSDFGIFKGYEWDVAYRETFMNELHLHNAVYVKDIAKLTPDKIEELFTNKKYLIYKDEETYIELAKPDTDYFVLFTYRLKETDLTDKKKWLLNDVKTSNYYFMKIGDRYILKLIDQVPRYIIPLKNGFINAEIYSKDKPKIIKYHDAEKISYKEIPNINIREQLRYQPKRVDGGYKLENRLGVDVLGHIYDTIHIGFSYIITYEKQKPTIYTATLKNISPPYLQAAYLNDYTLSTNIIESIINNEHAWIENGEVVKEARVVPWESDLHPSGLKLTHYFITKSEDSFFLQRIRDSRIDSLTFESSEIDSLELYMDEAVDSDNYKELKKAYCIFKKGGKFGIASISVNSLSRTFSLKVTVPAVYDRIAQYYNSYSNRTEMLIYRNGLVGLYPYNKSARYVSISNELSGSFVRFTLPFGQQGWLSVRDGEEFIDK